jgi:7-cyano-7-deazaguanine synthase in queuosine biosynthesis
MNNQPLRINKIYCGELCIENIPPDQPICNLSYYKTDAIMIPNVNIRLDKFINDISKLPDNILDLLEISSYVYAADRFISRGKRNSVNNDTWSRSFEFNIPIRDYDFWTKDIVITALSSALSFMTGDREFKFVFSKYKTDPAASYHHSQLLFSEEYATLEEANKTEIILFSGGLDSLAGTIDYLNENPKNSVCLISHIANNSTLTTMRACIKHLKSKYGTARIKHYTFETHFMHHTQCREETQRTRMFLFSAIAFSISFCYNKESFVIFENGITSINLPKQSDIFHARASRTTHPKTIGLLKQFYLKFNSNFNITTPYYLMTKADVLKIFIKYKEENIIPSSVSCSSTRTKPVAVTHCGCCSQCIERRFAIYSENLDDISDVYETDFINLIPNAETRQRLYNFLNFSAGIYEKTKEEFIEKYFNEIDDIIYYWPGTNPDDKVDILFEFLRKNSVTIFNALAKMRTKYENLLKEEPVNSLLEIINKREYLHSPIYARFSEIDKILKNAIPKMFQTEEPKNEGDFNSKIQALLSVHGKFEREYPELLFGITNYRADHSQDKLIIEAKYVRKGTPPSKATEGISADITKIQNSYGVYFIVYDPKRAIPDDDLFISSFEEKRRDCYVRIYR